MKDKKQLHDHDRLRLPSDWFIQYTSSIKKQLMLVGLQSVQHSTAELLATESRLQITPNNEQQNTRSLLNQLQ